MSPNCMFGDRLKIRNVTIPFHQVNNFRHNYKSKINHQSGGNYETNPMCTNLQPGIAFNSRPKSRSGLNKAVETVKVKGSLISIILLYILI